MFSTSLGSNPGRAKVRERLGHRVVARDKKILLQTVAAAPIVAETMPLDLPQIL